MEEERVSGLHLDVDEVEHLERGLHPDRVSAHVLPGFDVIDTAELVAALQNLKATVFFDATLVEIFSK